MKTGTQTQKHDLKRVSKGADIAGDDDIAVLVDTRSHVEHYMHFIDSFPHLGKEYVVMVPYAPDDGRKREPEMVLLRCEVGANGETLYLSIRNRKEMKAAFEVFLSRFESAGGL
jgi:hypothetical protein